MSFDVEACGDCERSVLEHADHIDLGRPLGLAAIIPLVGYSSRRTASGDSDQIFDAAVRDFDGVVFGWVSDFRMDDRDLFHSDRVDGFYALSGTRNAAMDRLLDTLQVVVDQEQAKPLWDEYQRVQVAEHPYTPLFFPDRLAAVGARMRGVVMDVRGEWVSVRDWWIDPGQR